MSFSRAKFASAQPSAGDPRGGGPPGQTARIEHCFASISPLETPPTGAPDEEDPSGRLACGRSAAAVIWSELGAVASFVSSNAQVQKTTTARLAIVCLVSSPKLAKIEAH